MKKIVIGMLALAVFIFSANAQEKCKMKDHHPRHGNSMMMKGVNLSTAQKDQIKNNRESVKRQMTELNKNENITVKEYNKRKAAILKSQKEQMDNVLTPEQKKQVAGNRLEQQKMQELKNARKMDKSDNYRMKSNLNLSDDQVNKIKANREATHAKVNAIKDNSQLSQSEKKEQLMTLKETQRNSFKEVLTPEQISKMEESKNERMNKTRNK